MNEKINKHIDNTITHKIYVLESARILCKYLLEHEMRDEAIELIRRCSVHDNSKFSDEEMEAFTSFDEDLSTLKNPKAKLDEIKRRAIAIHWKNNSHHPEHFENPSDMTEMDIMEMACDCHARSMEFETDLLEFIKIRQQERFQLPEDVYTTYEKYCNILVNNGEKSKIKRKELK